MTKNGETDETLLRTAGAVQTQQAGPSDTSSRRTSPRIEARDHGAVTVHSVSYAVEICNVSRDGAQIRVRQGIVPFVGQAVALQFVSGTSIESRVVWQTDTLIGLRFDEPLPDVLDGVYFEDLGSDYFRGILKILNLRG